MPTLTQADAPTATRGALLQANVVIVTAALAGFAGLSWLTSPVAAAQAQSAAAPAPSLAQALARDAKTSKPAVAIGTSVPEASAVFAGHAAAVEKPVLPF
jgi:hypothetical protein